MAQQILLAPLKEYQPEQHANSRRTEPPGPAIDLAQPAAEEGGGECADIDTHVKNGEAGVAPRITFGVELAHYSGDIGF